MGIVIIIVVTTDSSVSSSTSGCSACHFGATPSVKVSLDLANIDERGENEHEHTVKQ